MSINVTGFEKRNLVHIEVCILQRCIFLQQYMQFKLKCRSLTDEHYCSKSHRMKPVWHTMSELQGRVHSIIELFREWQKGRNFETEGDTELVEG